MAPSRASALPYGSPDVLRNVAYGSGGQKAANAAPRSELVMYNPSGMEGVVLIRMPAHLANACAMPQDARPLHHT